eukprot:4594873-Pyramimonas_sp.AAC.1
MAGATRICVPPRLGRDAERRPWRRPHQLEAPARLRSAGSHGGPLSCWSASATRLSGESGGTFGADVRSGG